MNMRNACLPLIAAFASLLLLGAQGTAPTADPANGKVLVASDTPQLASNAEVSALGYSSVTKKFLVPFPGTVKVTWKVKSGTSGSTASVSVWSLFGYCPAPSNSSTTSTTYVNGKCVQRVLAGEIVTVIVKGDELCLDDDCIDFLETKGFMRDVRVTYDVKPGTGLGAVLP